MTLNFTKMHGLGNDFVVFDAISQKVQLDAEQVRFISDRHFGIGCDQVLLVERPRLEGTDFHYRIYNADGGEVEQCGNGARCFARFVLDEGLTSKDVIDVGTANGPIQLVVEADGSIRVNMGVPDFDPASLPFSANTQAPTYALDVNGESLSICAVSMGNPHAVLMVDDVDKALVDRLGPLIESHERFPQRVNAGFMAVSDRKAIDVRVFERGSGETLACGTGACAAVVIGRQLGHLDERVKVRLRGGELMVSWRGTGHPVWMTGPAARVFDGSIDL